MAAITDPLQGFKFRVRIDDLAENEEIGFTRVSGLNTETEVVEYREGKDPPTMRKFPGLTSFGNVTLEKGVDRRGVFRQWRDLIAHHKRNLAPGAPLEDAKKTVEIDLIDQFNNSVIRRWKLLNAWPPVHNFEDIDAGTSDILLESVELAHEGIIEERLASFF